MPLANLVGAWTCWRLGGVNAYLGAATYGVIVAFALATMFHFVLRSPLTGFLAPLLPVEVALLIIGVPMMRPVHAALSRLRPPGPPA